MIWLMISLNVASTPRPTPFPTPSPTVGQDCPGVVAIGGGKRFECRDFSRIPVSFCSAPLSAWDLQVPDGTKYDNSATFSELCPWSLLQICSLTTETKPMCGGHSPPKNAIDCPGHVMENMNGKFKCVDLKKIPQSYCIRTLSQQNFLPRGRGVQSSSRFAEICPITLKNKCAQTPIIETPICTDEDEESSNKIRSNEKNLRRSMITLREHQEKLWEKYPASIIIISITVCCCLLCWCLICRLRCRTKKSITKVHAEKTDG